jgi:hypothetical protein
MRRRNLLVVLAGLAVVVAAGVVVVWSRKDLITRDRYDRIQAGMTRTKVEAILGGPPGDYRTVPTEAEQWQGCYDIDADASEAGCYATLADGEIEAAWFGNQGIVRVWFRSGVCAWGQSTLPSGGLSGLSGEGPTPYKSFTRTVESKRGPLDNLLWRAKRLWHRWFPE